MSSSTHSSPTSCSLRPTCWLCGVGVPGDLIALILLHLDPHSLGAVKASSKALSKAASGVEELVYELAHRQREWHSLRLRHFKVSHCLRHPHSFSRLGVVIVPYRYLISVASVNKKTRSPQRRVLLHLAHGCGLIDLSHLCVCVCVGCGVGGCVCVWVGAVGLRGRVGCRSRVADAGGFRPRLCRGVGVGLPIWPATRCHRVSRTLRHGYPLSPIPHPCVAYLFPFLRACPYADFPLRLLHAMGCGLLMECFMA